MCRWLAYIGTAVTPEKYLYEEKYSLIEQSQEARKSKSAVNGDGFGVGWYGAKQRPGVFKDVLPAWSDDNLKNLAYQIDTQLFMAHVRAATDTASNRTNCHPFSVDTSLFMHNGQIGDYLRLRREIEGLIPDELYLHRLGTTDSEILFLKLHSLMAEHSFQDSISILIENVMAILNANDVEESFRFTAAYADGNSLFAVRYSSDNSVPTLFCDETDNGWLLASEPLDDRVDQWNAVPAGHTIEINRSSKEPVITAI